MTKGLAPFKNGSTRVTLYDPPLVLRTAPPTCEAAGNMLAFLAGGPSASLAG